LVEEGKLQSPHSSNRGERRETMVRKGREGRKETVGEIKRAKNEGKGKNTS